MKEKLAALRQRWPWLDRTLDVQERFSEVNGSFVSSGVTISIFLAMFPLMLVAIAVVGFIAAGDDTVAPRLVENLGLTGAAADALTGTLERAADTRQAASVIGLLGLAWSGSGVASALQQAVRVPWQEGVQGLRERFVGMAWLVVAGRLRRGDRAGRHPQLPARLGARHRRHRAVGRPRPGRRGRPVHLDVLGLRHPPGPDARPPAGRDRGRRGLRDPQARRHGVGPAPGSARRRPSTARSASSSPCWRGSRCSRG
ncbi:MAG: YhjD/YihY/BrkB family envelope integrity protein [Acidimicrobiales bacterium]